VSLVECLAPAGKSKQVSFRLQRPENPEIVLKSP